MRAIAAFLLILVNFLLQSTFLSWFSFGGIIPNLLLILTATVGFMIGRKYGLFVGFFSGLLVDIFFGPVIGIYALIYMYIGYINGSFKRVLFHRDFKLPLLLIIASDLLYSHLCYLFLFFIKGQFHYSSYLMSVILPEVVYTTVIACILYPFFKFVFDKIEEFEKKAEESGV